MNISDVVVAALTLIVLLMPYILLPLIQKAPEKQRAALHQFAKYAVQKVEQKFKGTSMQKKDMAVYIVESCFKAAKLPVPDLVLIDAAIESFVYEMKQLAGLPDPPQPEPATMGTGPLPVPPVPPTNTIPTTSA
jgi:LL-H family phage holin